MAEGARVLWYDKPASNWNEALPLGNGRLGAMVFGAIDVEHLQLNEDSLWSGGSRDRHNPEARALLPEIRRLLREGKAAQAEQLCLSVFSGLPENQRHYEALADLFVSCGHGREADPVSRYSRPGTKPAAYRRGLDLATGISRVEYTCDGVSYLREAFVSHPHQVIVLHCSASRPMSCVVRLRRLPALKPGGDRLGASHFVDRVVRLGPASVMLAGGPENLADGIAFRTAFAVVSKGGRLNLEGDSLRVRESDEVLILVGAETSFRHGTGTAAERLLGERLATATEKSFEDLRTAHVKDHQTLYQRVSLSLDGEDRSCLPTDKRLAAVGNGRQDLQLEELYFNFGRYLLIASSRPETLPANLQGIWNDQLLPKWDSKWTVNINTQMNYWPAEVCGLPELHLPLIDLVERAARNGRETAGRMYGCRGYCIHHNLDLWADTAPQGQHIPSTFWPLAGLWLSLHAWDHFLFAPDEIFLRERAYPLLRGSAEFVLDYLVEGSAGELLPSPSSSPENAYLHPGGGQASLCEGSAHDVQLCRAVLDTLILAEQVLRPANALAADCRGVLDRLPPLRIGRDGRLLEWNEEQAEAEPGHRHLSHLWALFPGSAITPEDTPELALAARRSLEHRLDHGGGATGWSRGWVINLWAALNQGDEARRNLLELLTRSTYPNLFDCHPPFQIDGNFGGAAGMANMLVRSRWRPGTEPEIRLLPALPAAWPSGAVTGLRCRGGLALTLRWKAGRVLDATFMAFRPVTARVRWADRETTVELAPGQPARLS